LVNGHSQIISVVIKAFSDLNYYGYLSVLTGIQQEAENLGYSPMLHLVKGSTDGDVINTLNQIAARQPDGVIWANHEIDGNWEWTQHIELSNYPPIVFLHMHPEPNLNVISIDNQSGAGMAVSHLIDQGCRKIGIITGPMDWWETRARLNGWESTLIEHGLKADPTLIVEGDWFVNSGQTGMETLLDRHTDLDAVFACNDSMALGAINAAYRRGVSIPDDLLMVGFDNIPEAESFWPPLTTVRQETRESGKLAVQELIRIINDSGENRPAPKQHLLQPELIVRRSSRPGER
jgi:LacI family transcriptional regulator